MESTEQREPELGQETVGAFVQAAHGDLGTVQRMLAEEPRLLNARWTAFDESALEAASHMGRPEIAQHLLGVGAPLTVCTAAMLGMTDRVAALLDDDPALARATGAHRIPVLFHAALGGRPEIAELLLAHGGGGGLGAALHGAVRPGHREMVAWLLAHGATPDAPDYEGKTPLQVAEESGHEDIATFVAPDRGNPHPPPLSRARERGVAATIRGPRPTAHGPRPTAHGPRPTAHGPRPTAHGPLRRVWTFMGDSCAVSILAGRWSVHGRSASTEPAALL